jgi:hypothetical protein
MRDLSREIHIFKVAARSVLQHSDKAEGGQSRHCSRFYNSRFVHLPQRQHSNEAGDDQSRRCNEL